MPAELWRSAIQWTVAEGSDRHAPRAGAPAGSAPGVILSLLPAPPRPRAPAPPRPRAPRAPAPRRPGPSCVAAGRLTGLLPAESIGTSDQGPFRRQLGRHGPAP
jgi:hypothetical protein